MAKRKMPRTAADYADESARYLGVARTWIDHAGLTAPSSESVAASAVAEAATRVADAHRRMAEYLTVESIRRQAGQ